MNRKFKAALSILIELLFFLSQWRSDSLAQVDSGAGNKSNKETGNERPKLDGL